MVREIAKGFHRSPLSDLWWHVSTNVREALIDSLAMNHVRMADACGAEKPIIPAELVEFRNAIRTALADGVSRGPRDTRVRYWVTDGDPFEHCSVKPEPKEKP